MGNHTSSLVRLAQELFGTEESVQLRAWASGVPLALESLEQFDHSLQGPCMLALSEERRRSYVKADRDVFRQLQYCAMYIRHSEPAWLARGVVQMSAPHIESVVKRIGAVPGWPLGRALRHSLVKKVVDPVTWEQVNRFTDIYNEAKHNVSHAKDIHLFSVEDGLLAYFVGRRLGMQLYPLAKLATDLNVFAEPGIV